MKRIEFVIVAIAVAALIAFTSWTTYASGVVQYWSPRYQQNQAYGPGGGMMGGGGGMMGGYSTQNGQQAANQSLAHCSLGAAGSGAGMMGGSGMMNGGGMMGGGGGGMMSGGMMGYYQNVSIALTQDDAAQITESYLVSLNNPDLEIGEFEEYSYNFYVSIVEKSSSGKGVTEILIDRFTGFVHPEPQSMMWNTKYGGMMGSGGKGGMMGGGWFGGGQGSGELTVTPEEAKQIAQSFLNVTYPGTETGEIITFDGYYTIMTTIGGEHYGMLSINGYTGAVWYHTWHGIFIDEVETS